MLGGRCVCLKSHGAAPELRIVDVEAGGLASLIVGVRQIATLQYGTKGIVSRRLMMALTVRVGLQQLLYDGD